MAARYAPVESARHEFAANAAAMLRCCRCQQEGHYRGDGWAILMPFDQRWSARDAGDLRPPRALVPLKCSSRNDMLFIGAEAMADNTNGFARVMMHSRLSSPLRGRWRWRDRRCQRRF